MIDSLVHAWARLDYQWTSFVRCGVATAATFLLAWKVMNASDAAAQRGGWSDRALAVLGAIAFLAWWNFGLFHFPAYIQVHEHYHYYLGAKYFPELGYTRLYQCTAVADVEAGLGSQVATRWIRDLGTNELRRGRDIVKDPAACTSHFSADRWEMFKHDVAWFRSHRTTDEWSIAQFDHGYNGTPVWGIAGTLLAGATPVTDRKILTLALLDPLLIVVMWAFVWWAFGWRVMCVAIIWWGTNYFSRYFWTGGAFLRTDWLAFSVIGICLVKRGRPAAGGAALTYATLLRIFPGAIIVGLVLKAGMTMWRQRTFRLAPDHKSFAFGSLAAATCLVSLSFVVVGHGVSGGVAAWEGFAANSQKHLATPLTNNMGLKTIMSFEPRSRAAVLGSFWIDTPWDTWNAARRRVFEQRRVVYWLLVAVFLVLLAFAVQEQDDWVTLVLGTALIPVATELTCYYYAILAVFGLLWRRYPTSGALLTGLAAVSSIVPAFLSFDDDVYVMLSVLTLIYVMVIVLHVIMSTQRDARHLFRSKTDHEIERLQIGPKITEAIDNA